MEHPIQVERTAWVQGSLRDPIDATTGRSGVAPSWTTVAFSGFLFGILATVTSMILLSARGILKISLCWTEDTSVNVSYSVCSASEDGLRGNNSHQTLNEVAAGEAVAVVDASETTSDEFWPRCVILAAMLLLQSFSSYILADFGSLLSRQPSLIYFLTMLVGLGGNAGGQSVVLAVRRLALGKDSNFHQQARIALALAVVLGPLAFVRARFQNVDPRLAFTIGLSACVITVISVALGAVLPWLIQSCGFEPAHSAPMIQVAMDMIGISVVCILGTLLLGSNDENFS